ncbi:hypothetical protein OAC45_05270 [Gammaproteobacteria bacterium]|jgi:hypothetical protein|nr:hypothetical protein [Gammaproteobacteria bacterium]
MRKSSIILNTAGAAVSFFCFLHCILVILILAGILTSNLPIIKIFEDPNNHAWLIIAGFLLAALSLIKFNLGNLGQKKLLDLKGLQSKQFVSGGSMLGLSFLVSGVYSELLVIAGALTLLSMHAKKLLKN